MGSVEPFTDGSIISAAGQNKAHWRHYTQQGLNLLRQLMDKSIEFSKGNLEGWAEAYVDEDGQLNSVDINKTTASFDTDKYKFEEWDYYVIIEGSSLSEHVDSSNEVIYKELETDKLVCYCYNDSYSTELKRAKVMKSLFYDGYLKGKSISHIYSSSSKDIGKRALLVKTNHSIPQNDTNSHNNYLTGSFDSTTGNNNCSSWSYCYAQGYSGSGNKYFRAKWEMESGTVLNEAKTTQHSDTSDELGTDTSSEEKSNPSSCKLHFIVDQKTSDQSSNMKVYVLILTSSEISWTETDTDNYLTIVENTDYYADYSIPVFETLPPLNYQRIYHTIPSGTFPSNINVAIGVPFIEDWEDNADIQYKLTNNTEDSGWLNYGEVNTFTAFTSEPTTLIVKLIPKSSSPTTGYPSIKGFYINAWNDN